MAYDAKKEQTKHLMSFEEISYPNEYVIRIFKGKYPRLNLSKNSFKNKKICDVGCGDGRDIPLLNNLGFNVYGVEITNEIVEKIKSNLEKVGIKDVVLKVGENDNIPFPSEYFEYLLSWNACYYMQNKRDFSKNVEEFARVLKPGGYLILSIPKKTCFIYKGSETIERGCRVIKNDPYGVRIGEVLRMFENEKEIEKEFSSYFKDLIFGSIEADCFGLDYHWHLVVCRKK